MTLRTKLKSLMEARGINQKQLAIATGLSQTTVSKVVRNQIDRIDKNTVEVLCKYFDITDISDFFELVWQ